MRELKLSNSDKVALVDNEDWERLSKFKWCDTGTNISTSFKNNIFYNKTTNISLSKMIFNSNELFDHKDRNFLNCQKYNLRKATRTQNACNRRGWSLCGYKGVDFHRRKWRARIKIKGVETHIGYFMSNILAALAYDKKAKEAFKEFAVCNYYIT